MKTDSNLCPVCEARTPLQRAFCGHCRTPVVVDTRRAVAIWRLGEVRDRVALFRDSFDVREDCPGDELERAARTSVALDRSGRRC